MKPHTHVCRGLLAAILTSAIVLATAASTHASAINWGLGAQGIVGDTDVSTAGTLVGAFNLVGPLTTVNGVTFQTFPAFVGGTSATSGNFTLTAPVFTNAISFGAPLVSPAYQDLVGTELGASSFTLNIGGLVAGRTYQFQVWSDISALTPLGYPVTTATAGGSSVNLSANPSGVLGGAGQFATGTFVADATNAESIAFTSTTTALLNGFQLRQTVIPEPSSVLFGFAAFISVLGRRDRKQPAA